MPIYNSERFVRDSVLSVLNQTFDDWELIAVNDCSTDKSDAIVDALSKMDSRVKLIRLPQNSGVAAARNKAIDVASGRYIAFLDSDDSWLPKKLERQVKFMKEKDIAFSYTAYEKVNENGKAFEVVGVPLEVSYNDLLRTCTIGCLTVMYDTTKVGKVYMPTNTKREDFATWLKLLKQVNSYGVNEVLARYRVYSAQSSSKKMEMAKENWIIYYKIEKLGMLRSIYCFANYAFRGFFRTKLPGLARFFGVLDKV